MGIDKAVVVDALDDLRHALEDSGPVASGWIVASLGGIGEAALPAVREIIEAAQRGGQVPGYVARTLGKIGVPAVPQVIKALQHQNAHIRTAASRSLRQLAPKAPEECITPLVDALQDETPLVRANAAWALGVIGSAADSAVPSLLQLLEDSDRVPKALALIAPNDSRVIAELTASIASPNYE
jgi:HEAT repeat protein